MSPPLSCSISSIGVCIYKAKQCRYFLTNSGSFSPSYWAHFISLVPTVYHTVFYPLILTSRHPSSFTVVVNLNEHIDQMPEHKTSVEFGNPKAERFATDHVKHAYTGIWGRRIMSMTYRMTIDAGWKLECIRQHCKLIDSNNDGDVLQSIIPWNFSINSDHCIVIIMASVIQMKYRK